MGTRICSYICPCFFSYNRQQDPPPMQQNYYTLADIKPLKQSPKPSSVSFPAKNEQNQVVCASDINVNVPQEGELPSFQEYQQMQQDYDAYMHTRKQKMPKTYPIDKLPQNRICLLGSHQGQLLCKVKTVKLEPSSEAMQKTMQSSSKQQCSDAIVERYWDKRYYLFQKFDQGIKLDQQSWFSVTPEAVARHVAAKYFSFSSVLDGFCGAGGDSIQLAFTCKTVFSNDIDANKLKLLQNNAGVYGVQNIKTLNKDFLQLDFKRKQVQAVYFSPPWGGPDYNKLHSIAPGDFQPHLASIIKKGLQLSDNVGILLPNNTDLTAIPAIICKAAEQLSLCPSSAGILIEKILFMDKFRFIAVWIGSNLHRINISEELEYVYRVLSDGQQTFKHRRVIRKIRQEHGMVKLLECVLQSQKAQDNVYDQFLALILKKKLINQEKLKKLQELDGFDLQRLEKKAEKKQKMQKSMLTNNKKIPDMKKQVSEDEGQQGNQKSPNRKSIQQTVSLISKLTESSLIESSYNNLRETFSKDEVHIQQIQRSQLQDL